MRRIIERNITLLKRMEMSRTSKIIYIALLLFVTFGFFSTYFMYRVIPNGPGVSDDSVSYFENARSLITGNGFTPTAHFPPAYPMLLAIVGIFQQGDLLQASRLVSAVFFGLNATLIGIIVFISTQRSILATTMIIFAFLSNARVIFIHSMAWSEGPFISFSLIAFILLSTYIFHPKFLILLGLSINIGIAMATRYAGLTLLPPTVIVLLLLGDRPIKRKVKDTFFVIVMASIPLLAWLIRNLITAATLTNRQVVIHLFGLKHTYQLLEVISDFIILLDLSVRSKALLVLFGAILFLFFIALLNRKNYNWPNLKTYCGIISIIFILFFMTYITFIVISISLLDANITPSPRILFPALIAILIVIFSFARSLSGMLNKPILWHGFLLVMFILSFINSINAFVTSKNIYENGSGYNSREWKNSLTLNSLEFYDNNLFIYSNGPEVIRFQTNKNASTLPLITDPRTLIKNSHFNNQMEEICNEVQNGQAILVYLDELKTMRPYFPNPKVLEAKCNMTILNQLEDGIIYGQK
jgi:hypothetical protein